MEWLKDTVWCVAVGASFFGYGLAVLYILGKNPRRWLAAVGVGIGVVTGLLGVMNLLGWIRPVPLVFLVFIGDLLLIPLWRQPRPADTQTDVQYDPPPRRRWLLKTIAWAALACVACSALASVHSGIVNYFDDPQAYFAYPLEALQTGSLGLQPFSERRINTSLGANYLLDAVIAVDGDVRSIGFLDGTFAYLLFAASIWTVGSRFGFSFETKGLLLGLLVVLPLVEVNATPIYLQAALAIVLLLTMHETAEGKRADWRSGILWGLIGSVICLTKSSGIVFVFPLIAIFAVVHTIRTRSFAHVQNAVVAGATLLLLALPWMAQQHRNEGTYLSPLLGRGFHASHWGIVPLPAHTATVPTIVMVALPDVLALLVIALLAWKVRSPSRSLDVSLIAFILATLSATILIAFSAGGEGVDRFSFPFQIPALLLFAALLLATATEQTQHLGWRRTAKAMLALWFAAIMVILAVHYRIYKLSLHRLEEAAGIQGGSTMNYGELWLDNRNMVDEEKRALMAQSTVPPGERMLEATLFAHVYDFRRNPVFIADFPGMAGWSPGIPVGKGPNAVRDYLLNHDIHYFLCDRRLTHNNEDIGDFLRAPTLDVSLHDVIFHHIHEIYPYSRMLWMVSRDVRHNLLLLADSDTRLYDDGTLVVVRLETRN
jgi:hypothetical protein